MHIIFSYNLVIFSYAIIDIIKKSKKYPIRFNYPPESGYIYNDWSTHSDKIFGQQT